MFISLILIILVGSFCFYYFFHRNMDIFQRAGIPCLKPLPVLGNIAPIFLRQLSMTDMIRSIYNIDSTAKYVGFYEFATPVIMLRDPELVKSITIKNFDSFSNRRTLIDPDQDALFGKNLFSLRDDRWRNTRALLSPAFTSSKMKMMFKLISECGVDFADILANMPSGLNVMEMKDAFMRYTNDVIAISAFGITVNSMRDKDNEFYVMGRDATNFEGFRSAKILILRSFPRLSRWLNLKMVREKTSKFFFDAIRTTIATRDAEGIVRPDMIQLMMQSRNDDSKINLTIDDMTAQAFQFFIGGFETSSTLMCFCSYLLAIHQDVQEKLLLEVRAVLEQCEGKLTYEALHGMEYLHAFINETLRMYPTVSFMERTCVRNFELPPAKPGLAPFTVKPEYAIFIPSYAFHHDPNYFPEPDKFNPDRFLGDGKDNVNPFTYLPFGLGPRSCIGDRFVLMETKLVLFHLVNRCSLNPCAKTVIPMKLTTKSLVMAPDGGFWLTVEPRV